MTPELIALTLAALLQVIQIILMGVPRIKEVGAGKLLSPRDPQRMTTPIVDQLSVRTGRLVRAMDNHFEALILFTIAALVITVSDQSTGFTAICAYTFLAARVIYVPAYAFGWSPWRSIIWLVGIAATTLMFLAALV